MGPAIGKRGRDALDGAASRRARPAGGAGAAELRQGDPRGRSHPDPVYTADGCGGTSPGTGCGGNRSGEEGRTRAQPDDAGDDAGADGARSGPREKGRRRCQGIPRDAREDIHGCRRQAARRPLTARARPARHGTCRSAAADGRAAGRRRASRRRAGHDHQRSERGIAVDAGCRGARPCERRVRQHESEAADADPARER